MTVSKYYEVVKDDNVFFHQLAFKNILYILFNDARKLQCSLRCNQSLKQCIYIDKQYAYTEDWNF